MTSFKITITVKYIKKIASFDVKSLFTNVPVKETREIIIQSVYQNALLVACIQHSYSNPSQTALDIYNKYAI